MDPIEYLVLGAGPAGGAAALELARHAPAGSVVLAGDECHAPYERPPLSKSALAKAAPDDDGPPPLFGDQAALEKAGVRLMTGMQALKIDRFQKRVDFADGRGLRYGKLLIATGTRARRLTIAGGDLPGVFYLRSYDDARRLGPELGKGKHVVVIGGGFIGLEVAATACLSECAVTVIEAGPRLMMRTVPQAIAERVAGKFARHGVATRLGAGVEALLGNARVTGVLLDHGETLKADVVVVGIGAIPNSGIASDAGLAVSDGILTDMSGSTSDPSIYAAGDVARRPQGLRTHPDYAGRLEAWEPAIEQAIATARFMLGMPGTPVKPPWAWSDQFDWNIQVAGHGELADEIVTRSTPLGDCLTVLQLHRKRLVGLTTLNNPRDMAIGRRALQRMDPLDPAELADPSIPLKQALAAA